MKKFLLLAGVACLFTTAAEASVSQYVAGKISYDFNKVKVKDSVNGNPTNLFKLNKELISPHVAYGVRAGYVRAEIEGNFSHPIKYSTEDFNLNLKKYSLMANVYFDYLTCTPWTPYVGAGIGYAWLKPVAHNEDGKALDKSQYNFAWQVMAGVAYDINSNWTADLGYKYADLGRVRKNFDFGVSKMTLRDHEIVLGIRYNF